LSYQHARFMHLGAEKSQNYINSKSIALTSV
jgi:hypothetical protein